MVDFLPERKTYRNLLGVADLAEKLLDRKEEFLRRRGYRNSRDQKDDEAGPRYALTQDAKADILEKVLLTRADKNNPLF